MPFDVHDFPGASRMDRAATRQSRRLVAIWLFTVAAMILVMIVLGGATRLTGSGLSIMEWAPLMGALPPTTDAEWHRLFALYQKIPQYSLVNEGFGLDGFKHIFWLEWTHRLWGRLIGVVFLVPMLVLWATARIEYHLLPRLGLLFVLGGLQGAVGWFMVASGFLPDTTAVSPYRLVIHLALALALYAAIVWTGLSALHPLRHRVAVPRLLRVLATGSLVMVCLTILAGGFTAGLHAGLTYNTFPLMDGSLVPAGYATLDPLIRNLTENVAAVQFDHRLLATVTLVLVSTLAAAGWRAGLPRPLMACLAAAVVVQYALGVTTLLLVVPVSVATLHQGGAVILLTVILVLVHSLATAPRRRDRDPTGPGNHDPMSDVLTVSLETVFEAIPVGVGIVDASRRIVLMNRAFRESLGLPQDAFPPGTPVEDAVRASALRGVYGPGDPEAQVAAIMAADRTRPGRLRRRTYAGRSHDLYNTPLPDGGYVVTVVETTALLAARSEAEAVVSQTASALTSLWIGLAVFDGNRRLLLVNPRFPALLALPPDRLVIGTSFDVVLGLMETREEFATAEGAAFVAAWRTRAFKRHWTTRHRRSRRTVDRCGIQSAARRRLHHRG